MGKITRLKQDIYEIGIALCSTAGPAIFIGHGAGSYLSNINKKKDITALKNEITHLTLLEKQDIHEQQLDVVLNYSIQGRNVDKETTMLFTTKELKAEHQKTINEINAETYYGHLGGGPGLTLGILTFAFFGYQCLRKNFVENWAKAAIKTEDKVAKQLTEFFSKDRSAPKRSADANIYEPGL